MIFLSFQKKLVSEAINGKTFDGNISPVALEAQKGKKPQDGKFYVFASIRNPEVFPKRFCLEKNIINWSSI